MKFFSSDMLWKYLIPGAVVLTLAHSPLAAGESFVDLSTGKSAKKRVVKKAIKKAPQEKMVKDAVEAKKEDMPATVQSSSFLSDSTLPVLSQDAYVDHDWMVSFYPLQGWIINKTPGMALTMTEPEGLKTAKIVEKGYDKAADVDFVETSQTTYKRAVSMASIEGGVPFNQSRLDSFEQGLLDTFGKKMGLPGFELVNGAEFFDHRAEKDAIVAYTRFDTPKHKMKQMHVLIGGATNQVHLTYTDIESHFETRTDFVNQVWASMTSVNVEGSAPQPLWKQVEQYVPFAAAVILLLLLLAMIQKMQLRNNMRKAIAEIDLQEGEYKEYKSETVWNIAGNAPQTDWNVSRIDPATAPLSRASRPVSGMAPISNIFGSHF
jgi:hypothetical protein